MQASEKRGMSGLVRTWCLVLMMVAAFLANFAFAAEIDWIGASGGNWSDGANWEGGAAPGASDTAVFALENDTRVILAANAAVAKITVTGARLDLYSGTGKTLTLGGETPELAIDAEARLRVSGVRLASAAKVSKSGAGKLVVVGRAASAIDLDYAEGELLLEDEFGKTVTVAENDGLWAYDGISNSGTVRQHSPYAGTDGVYVGSVAGYVVTVTARREPIHVNGKFRISGDVLMGGTGSHGFAVVLHNDPRGYLARTEFQGDRCLGYAAKVSSESGAVRKSFAFGVLNHYSMGDGRVVWGWDGEWKSSGSVNGVQTEPFIYTDPCGENTATDVHPRRFKLQLDFDQISKTAVLTLVQDQSEIVPGGGVAVTWTKTLTGIDLTTLCEGDTATLAFTTDAGGRNTEVTVSNLKVEYFKTEQHIKQVIPVISSEGLWDSRCFGSNGVESEGIVYGSIEGSVHAGANAGSKGSVTARKEKVGVKGKFQISGKVTDTGTGSWGWALVLHNDSRGYMAHAAQAGNSGEAFSGTGKIDKSYAFRICNYKTDTGKVSDGTNGVWNSFCLTSPLIRTSPNDDAEYIVAGGAKYDFTALFDERAKTMVLTLSQDQGGATVTATKTFTDVDVPTLVGGESAWISLTSDAGGRTTSATIDNFKIEYLAYDDEIGDYSFFRSLETTGLHPVITAASGDSDFVAGLGELTVGCGTLQLGSLRKMMKVIPSENLWTNCCYTASGDGAQGRVYGERDGSVCAGANASDTGTVTARKEKVDVKGRFLVSGKVTDAGNGSLGWALVLHNDPRGCTAHAAHSGGYDLGFSGTDKIENGYAFRIMNFVNVRGQVSDGKNGVWNAFRTTDPLIRTNPFDGENAVTTVHYDFTALFDERVKTMVLTLTQEQDGKTVTATETFTDVDVPALVGGESAWLSLTSDAGGRTTNVTIDDFTIEYLEDGKGKTVFGCQGAAVVADAVELELGNAAFSVTATEQLYGFKSVRLEEGSSLSVSEDVKALVKSVFVNGTKVRRGVYTASDCDWIDGLGSVELRGPGMFLIVR